MHSRQLLMILFKALFIAVLVIVITVAGMISVFFKIDSRIVLSVQCFLIMLGSLVLDSFSACLAVVVYLGLGVLGLPILPEAQSGLKCFTGPMGGYLLGFIPCVMICGVIGSIPIKKPLTLIFKVCLFAYCVLLLLGVSVLYAAADKTLAEVLAQGFSVFIPNMLIVCVAAVFSYKWLASKQWLQKMLH